MPCQLQHISRVLHDPAPTQSASTKDMSCWSRSAGLRWGEGDVPACKRSGHPCSRSVKREQPEMDEPPGRGAGAVAGKGRMAGVQKRWTSVCSPAFELDELRRLDGKLDALRKKTLQA